MLPLLFRHADSVVLQLNIAGSTGKIFYHSLIKKIKQQSAALYLRSQRFPITSEKNLTFPTFAL
jgi:hypothetical protein